MPERRKTSEEEAKRNAFDLEATVPIEMMDKRRKFISTELTNDFVNALGSVAVEIMSRSDKLSVAIGEAVDGQEMEMVKAIRRKKEELQKDIEAGLISVSDAKNILKNFIEKNQNKFEQVARISDAILSEGAGKYKREFDAAEVLVRHIFDPPISNVFIADRIAPRFDPPTVSESAAIERFVAKPQSLQAFGQIVAAGMADISQNITVTFDVIERIFAWLNGALESQLSKDIEPFQPWSIGSLQPRILVRAMSEIELMREFVCRGFGLPGSKITPKDDWSSIRALEQFLYKGFLHEVALSKLAETPPNVIFATAKFYLGSSTNDKHRKEPTHAIIMKGESGDWEQALATIPRQHLHKFRECLVNSRWDELSDFGEITAKMKREAFLTRVRASEHVGRSSVPRDFAQRFDRKRFYKLLDIDPSNGVLSGQIELKICEKILKIDLESDDTFEDGTSPTGYAGDQPDIADNVREKLLVIDKFAADNPGKPVSSLILDLFPELSKAELIPRVTAPETPPAIWPDDRIAIKGALETPPDFIKRNYAPWLGKGLTRADVRRLDKPLSTALDNWLRRNPMPDDLDLPTLKEQNSRWVKRIEAEGFGAVVSDNVSGGSAKAVLKEAQRLRSAQYRHRQPGE